MNLSVVIPCRHQARFLRGLVAELTPELPVLSEIVVVDDASEEDDPRKELKDANVRIIRSDSRRGPSATRNLGAKNTSGKFIFFIDADDRIVPGSLKKALSLLAESPGEKAMCGILGGFIDADGERIFPSGAEEMLEAPTISHLTYSFFESGGRLLPNLGRFLFERNHFFQLRGFCSELDRAEDWDFILRWVKTSPILFASLPMYYYRIHQTNGTVRLREGKLDAHRKTVAAGKLVRMSHGLDVSRENYPGI